MIAHYNTEYRYYSFRGAYFPLRICLLVPHQKLYQFLQRNIYSTGTIAISTREYMIAVSKYPHCKIKFLCSHSCDILFQRIPMVSPLGLNSRQGPTRRGIWYVYQHPTRHKYQQRNLSTPVGRWNWLLNSTPVIHDVPYVEQNYTR
jgi:hypothetical protein